jgi:pyrimidine deaminase RibD-like protein
MQRAVQEARKSRSQSGRVSPKVGAVAVSQDGECLGVAHRGEDDKHKDHAEFYLLEKKLNSEKLANATVYTTLEPCFKRSEEKIPCAERLVQRQVARVVIGMLDPDPTVHGKGQMHLLKGGIHVQNFEPDLTKEILEMNRDFINDRRTPRFAITSHLNNAPILTGDTVISGIYKLKPSQSELYAVFTRRGRLYYPQGRFVIHANGIWECTITQPNPGGVDVIVAQINPDIRLWVDFYLKIGNKHNKWEGLEIENLPDGINVNHQVSLNINQKQ